MDIHSIAVIFKNKITFVFLTLFITLAFIGINSNKTHAAYSDNGLLRLNPLNVSIDSDPSLPDTIKTLEQNTLYELTDRSTDTTFTAYGSDTVTLSFPKSEKIDRLKIYGPAPYVVTAQYKNGDTWTDISGFIKVDLSNDKVQWNSYDFDQEVTTDQIRLQLTPTKVKGKNTITYPSTTAASSGGNGNGKGGNGNGGNGKGGNGGGNQATSTVVGIQELEVWGKGDYQNTDSGRSLWEAELLSDTPPANGKLYPATPDSGVVGDTPVLKDDPADNTFSVTLDRLPTDFKRAYITYTTYGAGSWVSPIRSINGHTPEGGVYRIASSAWTSVIEPINPEWLQKGNNTIAFSVPGKEHSYNISKLSILVEMDTGTNMVSSIDGSPEGDTNPAHVVLDGDTTTIWHPYIGDSSNNNKDKNYPYLDLIFDKPTQLDGVLMDVAKSLDGKIEVEFLNGTTWGNSQSGDIQGSSLQEGWNNLPISSTTPVDGLRLMFIGGSSADAAISEIIPQGSGTGATYGSDHIDITYPESGEYYGDEAYIRGFVQPMNNKSGTPKITVSGVELTSDAGGFEGLISKNQASKINTDGSWSADIKAVYPNGETITKTVDFWVPGDPSDVNGIMKAYYDTSKQAVGVADTTPQEQLHMEHDGGVLDLVKGAKDPSIRLTISSLKKRELPPLDPGMVNVTKGPRAGYRFGPHGMKFKKNITVELPYDEHKIPAGLTVDDIKTYYYDVTMGKWKPLERVGIDKHKKMVISHTNHFTDMINATITVPESPQIASFTPTSIKGIKAANPGAGIDLIAAPKANNMGDANLSYPIEVPPGRNGLQPKLAVSYSSGGGDGWLGKGWGITTPSITVDTRWGVPRYDNAHETETYMLDGEMLSPVAFKGAPRARSTGDMVFHPRTEGQFRKIVRHGSNPTNYWWEVTDKNGTVYTYGSSKDSGNDGNAMLIGSSGNIFKWNLRKVTDSNGNSMLYTYNQVIDQSNVAIRKGGRQIYLDKIYYTGRGDSPDNYKYEVDFTNDNNERPDIKVDARAGFKVVSSKLLGHIEVKIKGNTYPIRRYDLTYKTGEFNKSLLKSISLKDKSGTQLAIHNFDYYDTVKTANGLVGYQSMQHVDTGNDSVGANILGNQNMQASMIGGSSGTGRGASVYVGASAFHKTIAGGVSLGTTINNNNKLIALMDIDGDGLPDKVYQQGNQLVYLKNTSSPSTNTVSFNGNIQDPTNPGEASTPLLEINGIDKLSDTKSTTNNTGVNKFAFGFSAGNSHNNTTTIDNLYMSDVNGDGYVDAIRNGQVLFNIKDPSSGGREFQANSMLTSVPLGANGSGASSILPDFSALKTQIENENPLMDSIRRWVAPFDGVVRITGAVTLANTIQERQDKSYKDADGVRVSIEKDSDNQNAGKDLWHATIAPDDPNKLTSTPTNVGNVQVSKGDRLYFRVDSLKNGDYDHVSWSPSIQYVNNKETLSQLDVNGIDLYKYDANKDTILYGRPVKINSIYKGKLKFDGKIKLTKRLTDDVKFRITVYSRQKVQVKNDPDYPSGYKITETEKYTKFTTINKDSPLNKPIDVSQELDDIEKTDGIEIKFDIDSAIDINALQWESGPKLYYTEAYKRNNNSPSVDTNSTDSNTVLDSADDLDVDEQAASDLEDKNNSTTPSYDPVPTTNSNGDYIQQLPVSMDADIYTLKLSGNNPRQGWTAKTTGTIYLSAWVKLKKYAKSDDSDNTTYVTHAPDGNITFTVKQPSNLLAKNVIQVRDHSVVKSTEGLYGLQSLHVVAGETYYFDFTLKQTAPLKDSDGNLIHLVDEIDQAEVRWSYAGKDSLVLPVDGNVEHRIKFNAQNMYSGDVNLSNTSSSTYPSGYAYIIRVNGQIAHIGVKNLAPGYGGAYGEIDDVDYKQIIKHKRGDTVSVDIIRSDSDISVGNIDTASRYITDDMMSSGAKNSIYVLPTMNFNGQSDIEGKTVQFDIQTLGHSILYRSNIPINDNKLAGKPIVLGIKNENLVVGSYISNRTVFSSLNTIGGADYVAFNPSDSVGGGKLLTVQPKIEFKTDFDGDGYLDVVAFSGSGAIGVVHQSRYVVKDGKIKDNYIYNVPNPGDDYKLLIIPSSEELRSNITNSQILVKNTDASGKVTEDTLPVTVSTPLQHAKSSWVVTSSPFSDATEQTVDDSDIATYYKPDTKMFGNPYRGWSYFGYNANDDRDTQPIDESKLVLPSDDEMNDKNTVRYLYLAYPTFEKSGWAGEDNQWLISKTEMVSERRGDDDIKFPSPDDFNGSNSTPDFIGAYRAPRIATSDMTTNSAGFLANLNHASGGSKSIVDMMDLNGDRFPDLISNGKIKYTDPEGELAYTSNWSGDIRRGHESSNSYSIGPGSIMSSIGGATAIFTDPPKNDSHADTPPSPYASLSGGSSDSASELQYMDMNGDGLPDRVSQNNNTIRVALNTGYGFDTAVDWGSAKLGTNHSTTNSFSFGYSSWNDYFSGGVSQSRTNNYSTVAIRDINGDGLPDYIYTNENGLMVGFNTGTGFATPVLWQGMLHTFIPATSLSKINQETGDSATLNSIYYLSDGASTSGTINATVSYSFEWFFGTGWTLSLTGTNSSTVSRPTMGLIDVNGDGYPDSIRSASATWMDVALSDIGRTNLLHTVERPMGGKLTLSYKRSGNTQAQPQSKWVLSEVDTFDGQSGDGVDTQTVKYDYDKGHYARAERDFFGYKTVTTSYLDPSDTTQTDPAGKVLRKVVRTYNTASYAGKGLMLTEAVKNGNDQTYRETLNTYDLADQDVANLDTLQGVSSSGNVDYSITQNKVIFPKLIRTDQEFFEPDTGFSSSPGQSTYTTQQYDGLGNVTQYFDAGDTDTDSDNVTAAISYHNDQTHYIVGRPDHITVHKGGKNGTVLRERRAGYDDKGNLTSVSQYLADGKVATTDLTYDSYGNIATVTGPTDANNQRRVFKFTYDPVVHSYVTRIDDKNFGYHSLASYDYRFGKVTKTTDLNGNVMSYTYDDFGRTTSITGPYEQGGSVATIQFHYHPGESDGQPAYALTQNIDPENTGDFIDTVVFTDGLKRVLQTKKDNTLYQGGDSPREGRTVSGRVLFDALGRTVDQYYPVEEYGDDKLTVFNKAYDSITPTHTDYDTLDRTVKVVLPDGSTTTTAYSFGEDASGQTQFQTKVTDADGNQKITFKDARQLITDVREFAFDPANAGNKQVLDTTYTYDPMKQITEVKDAKGNKTLISYDNLGRRTSIDNPDTGKVSMGYDLAGNLTTKVTADLRAQKKAIQYAYEYGRLKSITYPNNPADVQGCTVASTNNKCIGASINVTYDYGADTSQNRQYNRVGRITKVTDQAGTQERYYGKLGEMTKEVDHITFDPSQKFTAEYFVTRFNYDSWGRMRSLTYPDGAQVLYHYDAGGNVSSITGNKGGVIKTYVASIQYDKFEQRKYIKYGNGVETTYRYNPQRRFLSHLTSTGKNGTFQNLSYGFDKVGNILSRTNDVSPINGIGGYSQQTYGYDSLYRLTSAHGSYKQGTDSGDDSYSLHMAYNGIHNIINKNQVEVRTGSDGTQSPVKGTSYNWDYAYDNSHPHAPSQIGDRSFLYDANGNQLGWTTPANGTTTRRIFWDDANRIQRINDNKTTSLYAYNDQGQRMVKYVKKNNANTAKTTFYVNQYYQLTNDVLVTKHIFVGSSRMVTMHSGGSIVFRTKARNTRSSQGRPTNTIPGNYKADHFRATGNSGNGNGGNSDKSNNGKSASAPGYVKSADKGNRYANGHSNANASNGKGNANGHGNSGNGNGNGNAGSNGNSQHDGGFPGQGLEHRSERADEVAQNVYKNPNLRYLLSDPSSPYYQGGDGSGSTSTSGKNCDKQINAGCTGGSGTIDQYTGDTAVVVGSASEEVYYYHPDHLGSTAELTDSDGNITEHLEYFPFGETWVQEDGGAKTAYLYTSKEYDAETGLYYYGARYYDPRTSIWQSADPILEKYLPKTPIKQNDYVKYIYPSFKNPEGYLNLRGKGGVYESRNLNLYAYSLLNPVKYLDPDGNETKVTLDLLVKKYSGELQRGSGSITLSPSVDTSNLSKPRVNGFDLKYDLTNTTKMLKTSETDPSSSSGNTYYNGILKSLFKNPTSKATLSAATKMLGDIYNGKGPHLGIPGQPILEDVSTSSVHIDFSARKDENTGNKTYNLTFEFDF